MKLLNIEHLITISPTIFATRGAYYNKKYRNATRRDLPLFVKCVNEIEKILDLKDHRFVLKPISNSWNGVTIPTTRTAFIDPRRYTIAEVIATTCHEALHLKQIQEGRLQWDSKKICLIWDGVPHDMDSLPDHSHPDMDVYHSLPWEMDVENQERSLFVEICKRANVPFKQYPQVFVKLKGEKPVNKNPKIVYPSL